jgi:histidyl-tRNA synthetase
VGQRQRARWCLIYGAAEDAAGTVTVRDMDSGEQTAVPVAGLASHLAGLAAGRSAVG